MCGIKEIKTYDSCKKERYKKLLDTIIDNILDDNNSKIVIQHLIYYGFTGAELIYDFGFNEYEVATVQALEMDNFTPSLKFYP